MWLLVPKGVQIRLCFTIPEVSRVRKFKEGRFVGEISVSKLQDRVYCALETLEETGSYGYVAENGGNGFDVLNIHVYDPLSPPSTITTYVLVTHEQNNPPAEAVLVGPEGVESVAVTGIEDTLSLVGPISLAVGAYWLKIRWGDGMELVVPLFFRYLIPDTVKKVYWLAKKAILLATFSFIARGRGPIISIP